MANATDLLAKQNARILLMGYPKAGKTGSLASLVSAGFKIRMLDYEGNYAPMLTFSDPAMHKNVDIVTLRDPLQAENKFIGVKGIPTAFSRGFKLMDHWEYDDEETGKKVDLGRPKDWGLDTVIVLDGTTSQSRAALRHARSMMNRTPLDTTDQVWGLAMTNQEAFLEKMNTLSCHVVVLSHLTMIGPREVRKGDDLVTQEVKSQEAEIVPTRLYPTVLGRKLPPMIGGIFSTQLLVERIVKGGKVSRVIRSDSGKELDTNLSVTDPALLKPLPVETGLASIFDAITPGIEFCLATGNKEKS